MTTPSGPVVPPGAAAPVAAVVDGLNVDAVAAAVEGCAGVAGLDGGRYGEVATYLPGRVIPGVMVSGGRVTVQIRSRWVPVPGVAALITAVLAPLTGSRPVDVLIADIDDPPADLGYAPAAGGTDLAAGPLA